MIGVFKPSLDIQLLSDSLSRQLGDALVMVGSCPELLGNPDMTVLVVVVNRDPETAVQAMSTVRAFRDPRLLLKVMTVPEVVRSLDVFPLEFSLFASHAHVWHGQNVFFPLKIEPHHLRRECEFYLRSCAIKIREALVFKPNLKRLIQQSWPQMMATLQILLSPHPRDPLSAQDVVSMLEANLPSEDGLIRSVHHSVFHRRSLNITPVAYSQLVSQIVGFVDRQ